jgi:hypothetical protein
MLWIGDGWNVLKGSLVPSVAVLRWWNLLEVGPSGRWVSHGGLCPWKELIMISSNELVLTKTDCFGSFCAQLIPFLLSAML